MSVFDLKSLSQCGLRGQFLYDIIFEGLENLPINKIKVYDTNSERGKLSQGL